MTRTGTTADLRHRWTRIAKDLESAKAEMEGIDGLVNVLNSDMDDYRSLVAQTAASLIDTALTIADAEAHTVLGD